MKLKAINFPPAWSDAAGTDGVRIYARFEVDPGAVLRLLQPFAVLGLSPTHMHLRPSLNNCSFAALTFEKLDFMRAILIRNRIAAMPGFISVRLSRRVSVSGATIVASSSCQ